MNLGPEYRFIGSSVDCDKMSSCLLTLNLRDIMHKCEKRENAFYRSGKNEEKILLAELQFMYGDICF